MKYIDGATIDDCKNALRQGATLQTLGERLGIDPAELARLIGVPVIVAVPVTDEPDLWRSDELDGVL